MAVSSHCNIWYHIFTCGLHKKIYKSIKWGQFLYVWPAGVPDQSEVGNIFFLALPLVRARGGVRYVGQSFTDWLTQWLILDTKTSKYGNIHIRTLNFFCNFFEESERNITHSRSLFWSLWAKHYNCTKIQPDQTKSNLNWPQPARLELFASLCCAIGLKFWRN